MAFTRTLVALSAVLALWTPPQAAAANRCEFLFTGPATRASIWNLLPKKQRAFDAEIFSTELALYKEKLSQGEKVHEPQTAEGQLAFFEASASIAGRDILALENWIKSADPKQVAHVVRGLMKLDLVSGLRPSQVEDLFVRLYLLTHSDPRTYREVASRPIGESLRKLIVQRIETELGTKSFLEALESLGLINSPGVREKVAQAMRKHPNLTATLGASAEDVMLYHLMGVPAVVPDIQLLRTRKLPPEIAARVQVEGIDALYADIAPGYKRGARFDLAWHWARKAMMLGLSGYALALVMPSLLPPGAVTEEDSKLDVALKIIQYWKKAAIYQVTGEGADQAEIDALANEIDKIDLGGDR